MTIESLLDNKDKIDLVVVGDLSTSALADLATIITTDKEAGKLPIMALVPRDVYAELFDDGDFAENIGKFNTLAKIHTDALIEEYAAWKVLKQRASKRLSD